MREHIYVFSGLFRGLFECDLERDPLFPACTEHIFKLLNLFLSHHYDQKFNRHTDFVINLGTSFEQQLKEKDLQTIVQLNTVDHMKKCRIIRNK